MNPFMMGLMALAGLQNPDALASTMASAGAKPGDMLGGNFGLQPGLGGEFPSQPSEAYGPPNPTPNSALGGGPNDFLGMSLGQLLMPQQPAAPMGLGGPKAAGGLDASKVSPFAGAKMPTALAPIMGGGVVGGAPNIAGPKEIHHGNAEMDALMQLLMGKGQLDPLRVPNLGALLGGR